jgi:hypothetical protein
MTGSKERRESKFPLQEQQGVDYCITIRHHQVSTLSHLLVLRLGTDNQKQIKRSPQKQKKKKKGQ